MILTEVAYRPHLDKHCFLKIPTREHLISGRLYKKLVRVVTPGRELGGLRAWKGGRLAFHCILLYLLDFVPYACVFEPYICISKCIFI